MIVIDINKIPVKITTRPTNEQQRQEKINYIYNLLIHKVKEGLQ